MGYNSVDDNEEDTNTNKYGKFDWSKLSIKKSVLMGATAIGLVLLIVFAGKIWETNKAGHFQIKQAALTGNMTVRHNAGMYMQMFGSIDTYRNVATLRFGAGDIVDVGEGAVPVDVIFNDGSIAKISGLVRVKLPTTTEGCLVLKRDYEGGYEHFIRSGVVPIVNNAIKLSANLRTAQDAYTNVALFQQSVDDQLRNGIYVTKKEIVKVENIATGEMVEQSVTVIVYNEDGTAKRVPTRLQELGCEVAECVIDIPDFDEEVKKQIAARKNEAMKTELAKQSALRAKQDAITAEEQGKANVATAKYTREVEKVKEVTDAQKVYEVGVIKAEQEYKVAQLQAKQAEEEKKATIFEGQGKAEANRLQVQAGLSPQDAAKWKYETAVGVASALSKVNVPTIMIGGGDGKGGMNPLDAVGINQLLQIMEKLDKK